MRGWWGEGCLEDEGCVFEGRTGGRGHCSRFFLFCFLCGGGDLGPPVYKERRRLKMTPCYGRLLGRRLGGAIHGMPSVLPQPVARNRVISVRLLGTCRGHDVRNIFAFYSLETKILPFVLTCRAQAYVVAHLFRYRIHQTLLLCLLLDALSPVRPLRHTEYFGYHHTPDISW